MHRPPRIARSLLAVLLPADERRAVLRDLDDEFARHVRPERGVTLFALLAGVLTVVGSWFEFTL